MLPSGQHCPVRFVQYRCDNLERNKILNLSENFATSTYFSAYNYMKTEDRLNAKSSFDIRPQKFTVRNQQNYEKDCENFLEGLESHGVKERSIFCDIPHVNVVDVGVMAPCVMHDVFSGVGREGLLV